MWQDQPVATARELLASDQRIAWPAPLVRFLRERSFDMALDWVFRISFELLRRTGSPHTNELLGELDRLRRWRTDPPPTEAFFQLAEDIWYRPNRDVARTALSHFCMDLAKVVCPDLDIGVNWLWHVPSLLCDDNFHGQPRIDLVEWSLSDFESFAARLPKRN